MRDVKNIRIADFSYPLPDERIAAHPLACRDACRLLRHSPSGEISHHEFRQLPDLIPDGALMVCNNTKVINARLLFQKSTGACIEIFLFEPSAPSDYALVFQAEKSCRWKCLVGHSKRWKSGPITKLLTVDGVEVTLTAIREDDDVVNLSWSPAGIPFARIVDAAGKIPIPPYLNRDTEASDSVDYQTVYSSVKGSVAAPTAGLHFTPDLLDTLRKRGVEIEELSLHVGAGTFRPVKSDEIGGHDMHAEHFSVEADTLKAILKAKEEGRQIVAVGTTSVRSLESLPYIARSIREGTPLRVNQWDPYTLSDIPSVAETVHIILDYLAQNSFAALSADTSIMIAPGFDWKIVDVLVTNFHQPQSTLLLLVDAFLDRKETLDPSWRRIYDAALAEGYRFLSYGDACLLFPHI